MIGLGGLYKFRLGVKNYIFGADFALFWTISIEIYWITAQNYPKNQKATQSNLFPQSLSNKNN